MRIYLKNIRVKFHTDPIRNSGALGCFCEMTPRPQVWRHIGALGLFLKRWPQEEQEDPNK